MFLTMGLSNVRSASRNADAIADFISTYNVDILALTETWLSSEDGERILLIACPPGFNVLHVPRSGARGGGVAVLHRSSLRVSRVNFNEFTPSSFEFLGVTLQVNSITMLLIVIYRPPRNHNLPTFWSEWSSLLEKCAVSYTSFLLMGDFNFHVDVPSDTVARNFLAVTSSFGLQQHVAFPTHIKGHTLDLVLSSPETGLVRESHVSASIGGSDHFSVLTTVRAHKPSLPLKTINYRPLKRLNIEEFTKDLIDSPFVSLPSDDLDSLLRQYDASVLSVLDKHAPICRRTFILRPYNPWYSNTIAAQRRQCRQAERKWRKSGLTVDAQIMQHRQKCLAESIFTAKATYYRDKISECAGNRRALSQFLNHAMSRRGSAKLPHHKSPGELAERFAAYFLQKIADIRASLDDQARPSALFLDRPDPQRVIPSFYIFRQTSPDEVRSIIIASPTKSCPLDPMPTHLLKRVAGVLAPSLSLIVNLSLNNGVFPEAFKLAHVIPLLKKPSLDPDTLSNYRPVSNLVFISKLLERVVALRMNEFLSLFELLPPFQSAYRSYHSTETALLRVANDLLEVIDQGGAALLALLDLSAAFDTVDHQILLHRLSEDFGISGLVLSWFQSYLSGRKQAVRVAEAVSDPRELQWGVPQGSVLGPLLFTLYTSPTHVIMRGHGVRDHEYADDTQGYIGFQLGDGGVDQDRAVCQMVHCLKDVNNYLTINMLKNNIDKLVCMYLHSTNAVNPPKSNPLVFGNITVNPSTSARNLGVIFDQHLSYEQHIIEASRKALYQIRCIARVRRYIDERMCNMLVCSLVFPHLDYCNSLLYGVPQCILDRFQRIQNAAARLVLGKARSRYLHARPLCKKLHWLPIRERIEYKIATMVFKCLNNLAPSYLSDLLIPYQPGRNLRSSNRLLLEQINPELIRYGGRCFAKAAPVVWNNLSFQLRSASTITEFQSSLKTYLFRKAYEN